MQPRNYLAPLLLVLASPFVSAQMNFRTLVKHPPVFEYSIATDVAYINCLSVSVDLVTKQIASRYGQGDTQVPLRNLHECIDRAKDSSKEKLLSAIRYLENRPGAAKALKDVHLKWVSKLDAMIPTTGESRLQERSRTRVSDQALDASQNALELELDLGL